MMNFQDAFILPRHRPKKAEKWSSNSFSILIRRSGMYRKVNRTPHVFDHRSALLRAIKICHSSQRKLGDLSGLGQQKINYLLNRAQKVKLEDAWAIQEAT